MKKTIALLAAILLLGALLAGCGGKKSPAGAKSGKTVTVNGAEVTLDKEVVLDQKIGFTVSSAFHSKYSTLSGMMYYIPGPDGDTPYSFSNVFFCAVSSKPYDTLEKNLNALQTEPETFSDVVIEERTFGENVWTYASFVKHVQDPDTGEDADIKFHQYMIEREFDGYTELVGVNIQPADDTAAFETEFMNSLTFLK